MKKTSILEDLHTRIKELEDKKAKKEKEENDDTICPECGEDLYEVEDGVRYCERCDQAYEV